MRKLTVRREKCYAGSLAKVKIYVEDPVTYDLRINDVPCRLLGTIKNGGELSCDIEENEARIFAISDKLSRNICNDFYRIPAGEDDVVLSGKIKAAPFLGNPFLFDVEASDEVLESRKKNKKKMTVVMIIAVAVGFAIGFFAYSGLDTFLDNPEAETFSSGGMSITLTDEFIKVPMEGFTFCYGNGDVSMFALKESFADYPGLREYNLTQYGQGVIDVNGYGPSIKLHTEDGLTYFEYTGTNPDTGKLYAYAAFVYETDEAFWLAQFAALEDEYDTYRKDIFAWAKTVEF